MASRKTMSRNTAAYTFNGTEWICPACGNVNNGTAKFCTSCGAHRLSGYDVNQPAYGAGPMHNPHDVYNVQVAETPRKKSGALKFIAISLVTLLLLSAVGFTLWHFFLSELFQKEDGQVAVTEEQNTEQRSEENPNAADNSSSEQEEKTKESNANPNAADPKDTVIEEEKFIKGNTYTVVASDGVIVRRYPEKVSGNELRFYELSYDLQSKAQTGGGETGIACIKGGSKLTCKGMNGNWMKIDDNAWVCTYYDGETIIR